jgi:hypothetical protein
LSPALSDFKRNREITRYHEAKVSPDKRQEINKKVTRYAKADACIIDIDDDKVASRADPPYAIDIDEVSS